jgi:hypothetical protein
MPPENKTTNPQVGRIDFGPTEPRHPTQTEQRMMDAALRRSGAVVPDPEVERLRALLRDMIQADEEGVFGDPCWGDREADLWRRAKVVVTHV